MRVYNLIECNGNSPSDVTVTPMVCSDARALQAFKDAVHQHLDGSDRDIDAEIARAVEASCTFEHSEGFICLESETLRVPRPRLTARAALAAAMKAHRDPNWGTDVLEQTTDLLVDLLRWLRAQGYSDNPAAVLDAAARDAKQTFKKETR